MINVGSIVAGLDLDTGNFFTKFKQAQQESDSWQGKLKGMSGAVTDLGKTMTLGLTAPIIGVAGAIGKVSMDFESGMSKVQAISGASTEEMALLTKKAKEMGASTKFSASESAEALTYMSMAGWNTSEMLSGLDGVMNLAAASGEDLGAVSDIVTDALSAFGLKAEDSSKFADLLASTSSNANTNVSMLGESFKYVAPVAGALGYSADDTAKALGLMANAGIKGSQAGTSLRTALTNLSNPTGKMKQAMNDLGISITDNNGNMKSLDTIMGDLRGSFKNLDKEQQAQYASMIFGKEAMSGMLAIINASEEDYNKLTKATTDYNGAAKEMAEIMEDNTKGRITKLKSALEGVSIQLGESLLPIFEKGVAGLQEVTDWFSKLDDSTKETIVKTGLLVAAIGPALLIGGKVASGILSIVTLGSKVIGGIKATTEGVGLLAKATSLVSRGISGFSSLIGALPALINPVTLGIAGVGIAGFALYKHFSQEATPAVKGFGEGVSEATAKSANALQSLSQETGIHLDEIVTKHIAMTDEVYKETTDKYKNMTQEVLSEIENRKNEEIRLLEEGFAKNKILSEEEKIEILQATKDKYEAKANETRAGQEQVNQILELARQENRELTQQEVDTINEIKNRALESGLEAIAKNAEEENILLRQLHENKEALEIERIQEVLKRSISEKDEKIRIANENYESQKTLAEQIKNSGIANADEKARVVLQSAKTERDEAIRLANEEHGEVTRILKEQSGEQLYTIDWTTGESLSKWGAFKKKYLELTEEQVEASTITWDKLKTGIIKVVEDINRDGSKEFKSFNEGITNIENKINENADKAWNYLKTNTISIFSTMKTEGINCITRMKEDTVLNFEYIKNQSKTKVENLKNSAINTFGELAYGTNLAISNIPNIVSNIFETARNNIVNFGASFFDAGKNIVRNIADGIISGYNSVIDSISSVASTIRDFFPFSPAKRGPLRDLHKLKFGETISHAIYNGESKINKALEDTLQIPPINAVAVNTIGTLGSENSLISNDINPNNNIVNSFIKALESARGQEIVINIDGREVARVLAPLVSEENDRIADYVYTGRGGEIW